ncbi:hypothetical protein HMPREF7215_0450 [Pyramidobacter piscolens W5455]|uniref:Uncharacterized protein n=1 Tax=Pyramidobacter piscolens W5455 TaxID=352165 RepID=A0ABM9ZYD8_9BACT|nr:hypothetical protein HMPREF7215_0450 [Pyramidobacter piscolens W5455]
MAVTLASGTARAAENEEQTRKSAPAATKDFLAVKAKRITS